jgi:hypothetical protein
MLNKEEIRVVIVEENSSSVQGGRVQEQKCTIKECFIERIWRREHKIQKNRKCKGCAEDTDAGRALQCNRTTTRLVSH